MFNWLRRFSLGSIRSHWPQPSNQFPQSSPLVDKTATIGAPVEEATSSRAAATPATATVKPPETLLDDAVEKMAPRHGPRIVARRDLMEIVDRLFPETEIRHWTSAPEDRWLPVGLVFRRAAFLRIVRHIDWGQHTRSNEVEQGGLLVGAVFRDGPDLWGDVLDALPAFGNHGTAAHLFFGPAVMRDLIGNFYARLSAGEWPANTTVIGWYHTHPNELPVFMSGTDMATQRAHFGKEWQYAVVLNPHTQMVRCFRGAHALECNALLTSECSQTELPPRQPGYDPVSGR